ncbi:MAG: hypothetical protein A2W90_09555 [Bacteroidetes bacterium GWF2_42_66]|nr:MAG: hypothetical protein A2W92_17425 [Bacteroidetes bacterium GWA2_42_15]OFX97586.1 MAG: hypothetical protein A2W89_01850 [Bacteroidetes bacterium GWE2_42_39]OFY43719.1 MAG: hypothetical protein A2W90_09555 [Bacteroidetes bacterium GWF2_42_66]HBL76308.1 hypothetical protein [Prolixibacteraceae bacterium]HCR89073.1 hypothetical protein [Prolixibacteraceae bacterium]
MSKKIRYVALLRGINVGGHHKVPMAELCSVMTELGFENVITLLNSGNVIFDASARRDEELEATIAGQLEKSFGFPVPVLLRRSEEIRDIVDNNPFENIEVTKDIRLYISFLKQVPSLNLTIPWASCDNSFRILEIRDRTIFSVLDLAVTQTTKGMDVLEQFFGKDITTRNLNTIERIAGTIG